jgi:hypothetical protein
MASEDIGRILHGWPYRPGAIGTRRVRAADGREVLQLRIEMGVLQLEVTGRPDGTRPKGAETYLHLLRRRRAADGRAFELTEHDCEEMDREFLQYYHRRICWLALREFRAAVADADHTLELMDFALAHSPSQPWTASHEQYRCFVLFHRTQAAALAELEASGADAAIEKINHGLDQIRRVLEERGGEDPSDRDEQVAQLVQLKEWLRQEYRIGRTLEEQLADAVAAEKYELAAELRDQIAHRDLKRT